jgi:diguanylate cyclase (GGDEF)-like protein/PAS domain S-box-containing protein
MNDLIKKTAIQSAQLEQLLAANIRTLAASTLLAIILACMQRDVIAANVIISWLSLTIIVNIARIIITFNHQRNPANDIATVRKRLTQFRFGVIASSLLWGATSILMFPPGHFQHQMFVVFVLTGLSAGGIVSYSVDLVSAIAYTLVTLTPMLIRLFLAGDSISLAMSISGFLYLIFLVVSIRNINRNLMENITLHFDAVEREKEMAVSEERYRLLLNYSPVGIAHFDTNHVATYCNQNLADILHCSVDQVVNRNLTIIKDSSILPALNKALTGEIGSYEGHYQTVISDAEGWIDLTTAPARDSTGSIVGGIAIVQDITAQKQAADEIKQLAFYDPLTNLPNRRLLLDRLDHALAVSARTGRRGALLFLDLDHFKRLNDTLGHDVGDLLLKQVAERLLLCVRESDTVARFGGDEFIVMLEDLSETLAEAVTQVEVVGNQIIATLNRPYCLNAQEHFSTPSVGVAMFGDPGQSHEELLKHADIAMYQAKKAGRNAVRHFQPEM